jgi:glycine/D-amino acid oxidase-like deaminating enzyme
MTTRREPGNGGVSFWWQQLGMPTPRQPLGGNLHVDVCIVGGGYTGLWTAYYLKKLDPRLRVVILEARFAGFGASGRNGGWVSNAVTGGRARYAKSHGRDAAVALQLAHNDTVDEVLRVLDAEGIAADQRKGGELRVAREAAQLSRLREEIAEESMWPGTDLVALGPAEAAERIGVAGVTGAVWDPHCAKVDPAKLAAGLASVVEGLGVRVFEETRVDEILPGRAVTVAGTVFADHVIRATEGFTADLRGQHRTWLPMNSSMVVTAPLPDDVWARLGWAGYETLGDYAHVYMYAQRTADGRIAFGGRGVPYRFGSRVDQDGETQRRTIRKLTLLLHDFFPEAGGVPIDHAWAGVLAVPRDWAATVGLDRTTGLGWAGGYVGTGVAAANLAGRTLADLVLARETDLTRLPWVGRRTRAWEVEPLRFIAVHGLYAAYRAADAWEGFGGSRTSPIATVANRVAGR